MFCATWSPELLQCFLAVCLQLLRIMQDAHAMPVTMQKQTVCCKKLPPEICRSLCTNCVGYRQVHLWAAWHARRNRELMHMEEIRQTCERERLTCLWLTCWYSRPSSSSIQKPQTSRRLIGLLSQLQGLPAIDCSAGACRAVYVDHKLGQRRRAWHTATEAFSISMLEHSTEDLVMMPTLWPNLVVAQVVMMPTLWPI